MCNVWNNWQLWKKSKSKKLLVIWAWKGKEWIMNTFEREGLRNNFVNEKEVASKEEGLWTLKEVGVFFQHQEMSSFVTIWKRSGFFMSTKRLGFVVSIERGCVLQKGCALEGSYMLEKGWLVSIDKHLEGIRSYIG